MNKLHCQILLVFIRSGRATGGMNNVISSVLSLATTDQLQVQAVPHTGVLQGDFAWVMRLMMRRLQERDEGIHHLLNDTGFYALVASECCIG